MAAVNNAVANTADTSASFNQVIRWTCNEGYTERLSGTIQGAFEERCTDGTNLGETSGCDQVIF